MSVCCDVSVCRFGTGVYAESLSVVMLVCVDFVIGCNAEVCLL